MKNVSSAVGFTAKLKPEIRLAQAISEFNASLQNKNQRARFKNLHSQSPPSPDDVIRLTEEINRDGARTHRSWRPYGTRLVAILERMRQFAPIGDVLVGGSQNLIACGVWAVVRLSLETSLSFLSYFENVTNMMMRLGRSLSLHEDFAMLFPKCSTLQSYICEYTIVMVNICAKIVHNCAKSAFSQLAASLTSTFDAVFKPLESEVTTWGLLIEKRTTVLLAKAELQSHSSVLDRFNRLQITMSTETSKRQRESRKHRLLAALCPEQSEFDQIWRRERKRGTSSWMYESDEYKSWLFSKVGSVLWLNGNLGSGKTVTMASAVAQLTLDAPSVDPQGVVTASYFFCQSNNPKTLSATNLLGSIVGQILQNPALEPSLMSLLEQQETMPFSHATLEECIDILIKGTPSNWRGIFVLDGLDEISEDAVDDIFHQLQRLKKHRWISILCSSRPTSACYSTVKSRFDEVWTLSMETADRSKEIRAYLAAEISRWNTIRPLPTEIERLVEEQLLAGCQGMFLWLSLQIEDICPRYTQELRSDSEILDILGNLPKDLPGAFDKALSRMRDEKQGSKLLKLVASAEPPMNMDELRVASNVDPGNTTWDNSTLIGTGKALISAYGGSLLDIDEEDLRVRFIHYSVLLHLTAPSSDEKTGIFHFDLSKAEMMLGAVCVTYLSYAVFENRISKAQKASFAQIPQVTASSVMPSEVFRKGVDLLAKYRRERDPKVDLERLSYELQNQRRRVRDDVHLFLDYAKEHWLFATRDTWSDNQQILPLWKKLITNPFVSDSLPWDTVAQAATWALENNHATLFQHYLHSDYRDDSDVVVSAAADAVRTGVSHIRLSGQGLGWLGPLYLVFPEYKARALQAFVELGCHPFNPALAESPSNRICGPSLVASAVSHLVAGLKTYSERPEMKAYILFLSNYLDDPNLILEDGLTILYFAIDCGCTSLAHELLSRGADPNERRMLGQPTPLQLSTDRKFLRLAKHLVQLGADVTFNKFDEESPLLFLAIDESNWELFFALLRTGGFSCDGMYGFRLDTACHRLCRSRSDSESQFSEAALKALIKYGANIRLRNSAGETPLLLAVRSNKKRLTEILLEHGADPRVGNYVEAQPLHFARDAVIIQRLVHQKADPEAAAGGHTTPLMVAAYQGRAEAVRALLDNGADPKRPIGVVGPKQALPLGWLNTGVPQYWATAFDLCLARLQWELKDLPGASRAEQSETTHLCSELVSIIAQFLRRGISLEGHDSDAVSRLIESLSDRENDANFAANSYQLLKLLTESRELDTVARNFTR